MTREQHPGWEEELMPYVDGQLDAAQASGITEHLKTCEACSAAVADTQRLSTQMSTWKVEESPETLRQHVVAEVRRQRGDGRSAKGQTWWSSRRTWAYGSAAAFAIALFVVIVPPSLLRSRQAKLDYADAGAQDLTQMFELEQDQNRGQSRAEAMSPVPAQDKQLPAEPGGPMVIRTARLILLSKEFDSARSRIEAIVRQSQGYLDELTVLGEVGSARNLSSRLRVPSDRLDSVLTELRQLGKVREESQNSSDVTSQYVDLQARLVNSRNTEQRLLALQRERTDKLVDVVNVEREISRVREEIERMVAQQKDMSNKVQFATIHLNVAEEYRAAIESPAPSAGTQLRNASIDGYRGALDSLLAVALSILRYGPMLLLWAAVLVPVVVLARRLASAKLG